MDGYIADWSRDYFIDKYTLSLLDKMSSDEKEKYIYNSITSRLKNLSNLDLEDEIKNHDPDIILGDIN